MSIDRLLSASDAWASWIVAMTWQLAVLVLAAWVIERVLRVRQAGARYGLWWFVLVAPLVLGPVRFAVADRQASVEVLAPAAVARVTAVSLAAGEFSPPVPAGLTASVPRDVFESPKYQAALRAHAKREGLCLLVFLAWLLGCAGMGLRLVVGHRRVSRLVARSTLLDGSIAADVFQRLGVSGVRLYESEAVGAPTVCGLRRPAIIFPRGWFDSVERAEVESLLAHEVAHIKRRDVAANLVQRLIEIPLFFHPGVWLASGRIALAREELADGWALRNGAEADTYARALTTAVERAQKGFAGAAVGIAESKSMLRRRVDAVLRAGSLRRLNLRLSLALLLMGALVATGLAAFRVVAADEEGKESSGAAVEVVSPEAALSPQELDSVLSTAGLQSYRFTYEFDRPHQLHFTFEEYVDGVKVGNGPSSSGCGSAMRASDAKRAVLIVTRREKGTIGFWFSVGGGGSGLSGFEIDEASGYTSGLLRGAELEVGKRVPIFYYASDRESVGGIDALDEMIASYDRVTVVLAEIVLPGEAEEDAGEAGSRGATTLIQGGLRAPDGKPAAGAG